MTNESRPRSMPFQTVLPQLQQQLVDANNRIDELDATLDKVQESWMDAKLRIDELTTALHQLVAQINSSASAISDSLRQDGDAYAVKVSTLTALGHMRDDVLKVLNNAPADGGNLRELLNKSMAENVALLQQVAEMQEALNMQIKTFDAMKLNSDRALENWMNTCAESDKRIDEFTKQLDLINDRQRLEWARAENAEAQLAKALDDCQKINDMWLSQVMPVAKELDVLTAWSQAAYKRLGGLMVIGVSMTPDAVTAKLLSDAPANVAADVDPFSAELAADLDCTEKDVYEYAVDSVGASGIKTIEGCHSAGLHSCYGELWLCQECGNFFCDAEGSDDGFIDFCDECWAKMQAKAK